MEKTIEIPEGYEARIEGNKVILEPKESEDERLRSLLVWQVHRNIEDETNDLAKSVYDGIKGHDPDLEESIEDWKKCLAYLERQKEQKSAEYIKRNSKEWYSLLAEQWDKGYWKGKEDQNPAGWSKEDERNLYNIIEAIKYTYDVSEGSGGWHLINYLKFRLRPQPSGNLAISFMNYLDEHRPEGKMCLSNGECADIEEAFKKEDWAKVIRYVNKYQPHWKPSEKQMNHLEYAYTQLKLQKCYAPHVYETLGSLYDDLKKLI